jgi:hypothetical protein
MFFWVKNTYIFYADADLGSGILSTPDPGSVMEKFTIRKACNYTYVDQNGLLNYRTLVLITGIFISVSKVSL